MIHPIILSFSESNFINSPESKTNFTWMTFENETLEWSDFIRITTKLCWHKIVPDESLELHNFWNLNVRKLLFHLKLSFLHHGRDSNENVLFPSDKIIFGATIDKSLKSLRIKSQELYKLGRNKSIQFDGSFKVVKQ